MIKKFLRIRASSCVHPDGLFRGIVVEDASLASSFTVSAIVSLSDGNENECERNESSGRVRVLLGFRQSSKSRIE